ncbi:hypothetical protein SEA_ALI17_57 [Gordonia phage Ali17]|uniref:Uncharacterized protein n=2 Tax=Leonardvirus TaxID=2948800 RepID=A0A385DMT6_9CAUD|nr:hypothetical protein J1772_gp57 [Gordonia phage Ali17]AXQ60673.1 hypothetical protein SEA_ALI17_57 [Gordonia phage Ali17]UTN93139.1 hypothetical protein SEA_PHAUCI_52 [Gordonia Phage Phauci]
MSSGQRPRRREYFPRMKQRGKHRPRKARVTVYGSDRRPVWPQPRLGSMDDWPAFLTSIAVRINRTGDTPDD